MFLSWFEEMMLHTSVDSYTQIVILCKWQTCFNFANFFLLLRVEYWFGLLLSESKDLVLKEWPAESFLTLLEFNKEVSFKPSFSLLVTYFLFRRKNVSWRDVLLNIISYTTFLHVLTYHPATLFNYLHTILREKKKFYLVLAY